jgi:bacterioferritin-associated ferredoxin
MAQAGIQVQLSVKEIYDKMCPKCQEKLRQLIKEKVSDEMVSQVIGETVK